MCKTSFEITRLQVNSYIIYDPISKDIIFWRFKAMATLLEQLKGMTTIVADTGDVEAIKTVNLTMLRLTHLYF
jgi:hypothetical protein